jgi:hypothetical protein
MNQSYEDSLQAYFEQQDDEESAINAAVDAMFSTQTSDDSVTHWNMEKMADNNSNTKDLTLSRNLLLTKEVITKKKYIKT